VVIVTANLPDKSRTENSFGGAEGCSNQKRSDGPKGKILRVKQGYNPNSSSMGSIVFALPAALLGITAAFGVVSGVIMSVFMKDRSRSDKQQASDDAHAIDQLSDMEG